MKIINNDCIKAMKEIEENSVDTIITDPPYGLSFMGKKWDYDVPSKKVWKECLRVLKPGGTALIFAGSRTQHRMAVNIEDSGFILKDCIMWLYGSGFPKATDISKQLDKNNGQKKVIGKRTGAMNNAENSTAQSFVKGKVGYKTDFDITEPATEEAKLWNGWKSHGLKPAYEPIIVAMKPNEGSYAQNALKHGVAGINIDGARIGYTDEADKDSAMPGSTPPTEIGTGNIPILSGKRKPHNPSTGRFPANLILDQEAGKLLDQQSGEIKTKVGLKLKDDKGFIFGDRKGAKYESQKGLHTTVSGASRFFYCAKSSKSERNAGCEGLEEKKGGSMDANTTDKMQLGGASLKGEPKEIKSTQNNHPTVKPLKLMEYLCTLAKTPTGGVVLDPFMGSGTTGIACVNTERDFIGIEREAEYVKIAKARIKYWKNKPKQKPLI